MKQSIEFSCISHPFLTMSPRRNANQYSLLLVQQGMALVRMGKHEHIILPNSAFWTPFDCLSSVTLLPNTKTVTVNFSIRLQEPLSEQGGFVELSPLALALIEKLKSTYNDENRISQQNNLLQVLKDEVLEMQPKLATTPQAEILTQWVKAINTKQREPELKITGQSTAELKMALRVREAVKLRKSGRKEEFIIEQLFNGNKTAYLQSCFAVLGSDCIN
ncbi:AraC family transcriptional regulator [Vibrio sp. Of7-15]|uniref:AraC family transcriptional regulator n=1 Tax=Vibrio sp. Of7-15 TaxID=2724879 RepID=UPI001EF3AA4D|nr:AraC family transcriptional regulator [Vibrio sp. Of7-15]MCG7496458.1 AraC family transcriptional regulator [Vibrio sp. Of7-15]